MPCVRTLTALTISLTLLCCDDNDEAEKLEAALADEPVADFNYELHKNCNSPFLEVVFINESINSDSYEWDFGDGTTSTEMNPKRVYAKAGNYIVRLMAIRGGTINQLEKEISIVPGPKVSLSYERTNTIQLGVEFLIATEGVEYVLNFGDGQSLISTQAKIRHTYAGRGLFEATVTVENRNCASVLVDFDN